VLAELPRLLLLQEKDRVIESIEAELAAFEPQLEELNTELATAQTQLDSSRSGSRTSG
jgi:chromosome segregation ATPase